MPEIPPPRRRPQLEPSVDYLARHELGSTGGEPAYVELHAKTNFSFLEGASHADELVAQAAELGYGGLAVTDRNSLAGVVRAHTAAKQAGLKLLIGAEIWPLDGPPLVLWASDRASYGRLSRLITCGRRRAPKGECPLRLADLAEHAEGLLAGAMLRSPLAAASVAATEAKWGVKQPARGTRSWVPDQAEWRAQQQAALHARHDASADPTDKLLSALGRYREVYGDRLYLLVELHAGPDDRQALEWQRTIARRAAVPAVAAGDVYYHVPERQALCDVLTAIRLGTTVAQAGPHLFANAERHLLPRDELALRFAGAHELLARTIEVADRCRFSLDELRYEYPEELAPAGMSLTGHLAKLTWEGMAIRYPNGAPDKIRQLVEHELQLIADLKYEAYFLTVWDLVSFARRRDILCQGRGSAANSAVCYALGITSVDPERIDVLFERFVSRERDEAPDIDVDFEHERREEVLQYLYNKYGRERAGMAAEVITYRSRSAMRDVGKALGLSLERVDTLAKAMDTYKHESRPADRLREAGLDPESTLGRQLAGLVKQLVGFPRHLSQHVGGMVMTRGPLCELVPIENAAMPDRTVIQWDKDDLDDAGILKVDCLALGMLTAIRKCLHLVGQHYDRPMNLYDVPPEDPAVYDMIGRADTVGVFQIESRAQMSMLPRLRPRCYYDLVIEVAIVRPGPIQGQMVHPYLRRRANREQVDYPNDEIREVLEKTEGVPIFQEQAMRLAVVAAGFTPGEADQLRRAMGAWRKTGLIEKFRQKLIDGMLARGLTADFAERVFMQIRGFGEYGFPESHAASFALLVYVSSWLKHYYPAAFAAALLNSQPMGFYAPAQLVRDAQTHGVRVLPPDVNHSQWDATLERVGAAPDEEQVAGAGGEWALRLGLRQVAGLSEASGQAIAEARRAGRFTSCDDLRHRTGLGRGVLERLARADALSSLELDRRQALWQSLESAERLPLFASIDAQPEPTQPTNQESTAGQASSDTQTAHLLDCSTVRSADIARQVSSCSPPQSAESVPRLPDLTLGEQVLADYRTQGLSLKAHPIGLVRHLLGKWQVVRAVDLANLNDGITLSVAGLVLIKQRPSTASGIVFVTLEDETGQANLIVKPNVWQRHHHTTRGAQVMLARGRLQRQENIIHVLAWRLSNLNHLLDGLRSRSRDFR